ncbi:NusA-like transcription termination signal-binding factor, partial [Candidatus Micrarchaeota archaeon]|nr:NusA-like transcription termination signal-binding factor [Candidatus Micrarchaeota archaeon]
MRIGSQEIQYLNVFQSVSRTHAKDCLIGNNMISFLVKEGQMGLTIGKNGENVKKLRKLLKKNVELFEHKQTPQAFLDSAFPQISFIGFETEKNEEKTILLAKTNSENKKK